MHKICLCICKGSDCVNYCLTSHAVIEINRALKVGISSQVDQSFGGENHGCAKTELKNTLFRMKDYWLVWLS